MDKQSFVAFLNKEFRREGETLAEFSKELKALTLQDREDIARQAKSEYGVELTNVTAA